MTSVSLDNLTSELYSRAAVGTVVLTVGDTLVGAPPDSRDSRTYGVRPKGSGTVGDSQVTRSP